MYPDSSPVLASTTVFQQTPRTCAAPSLTAGAAFCPAQTLAANTRMIAGSAIPIDRNRFTMTPLLLRAVHSDLRHFGALYHFSNVVRGSYPPLLVHRREKAFRVDGTAETRKQRRSQLNEALACSSSRLSSSSSTISAVMGMQGGALKRV